MVGSQQQESTWPSTTAATAATTAARSAAITIPAGIPAASGHAPTGKATTFPVATPLGAVIVSRLVIVRVVMAGKGQMPAFGTALSVPKIQELSGYVRRLGVAGVNRKGTL